MVRNVVRKILVNGEETKLLKWWIQDRKIMLEVSDTDRYLDYSEHCVTELDGSRLILPNEELDDNWTLADSDRELVRRIFYGNDEATEPQNKILEVLREYAGKTIGRSWKTLHQKLQDATGFEYYIHNLAGMTYLNARQSQFRLFMSHTDKNVVIDIPFIIENNQSLFSALEKRNAAREELRQNPQLQKLFSQYMDAFHMWRTSRHVMYSMLNEEFHAVRFPLGEMFGVK